MADLRPDFPSNGLVDPATQEAAFKQIALHGTPEDQADLKNWNPVPGANLPGAQPAAGEQGMATRMGDLSGVDTAGAPEAPVPAKRMPGPGSDVRMAAAQSWLAQQTKGGASSGAATPEENEDPRMAAAHDWLAQAAGNAAPAPSEQGDFMRGIGASWTGTKEMLYGLGAFAADAADKMAGGSPAMQSARQWAIEHYQDLQKEEQAESKSTDDVSKMWEQVQGGDLGALTSWLKFNAGLGLGFIGQQAAIGLISGGAANLGMLGAKATAAGLIDRFAAKMVAEQAAKIAATDVAATLTEEQIQQQAVKAVGQHIAALGGTGAFNVGTMTGATYEGAQAESEKTGAPLTGEDLVRVGVAGTMAGLMAEGLTALGMGAVTEGGAKALAGKGLTARVAGNAGIGAGVAGVTMLAMTAAQRFGAGQDLTSPEAMEAYKNAAASGVVMGAMGGAIAGAHKRTEIAVADIMDPRKGVDEAIQAAMGATKEADAALGALTEATTDYLTEQRKLLPTPVEKTGGGELMPTNEPGGYRGEQRALPAPEVPLLLENNPSAIKPNPNPSPMEAAAAVNERLAAAAAQAPTERASPPGSFSPEAHGVLSDIYERNIERRGGIATPEEAEHFQAMGTQPYNRVEAPAPKAPAVEAPKVPPPSAPLAPIGKEAQQRLFESTTRNEHGLPTTDNNGNTLDLVPVSRDELPAMGGPGKANVLTKTSAGVIDQIARVFGKKVEFFKDQSGATRLGGFVDKTKPNTIFVASEGHAQSHQAVFGHELYHMLKREMPNAAKAFEDVVREQVGPEGAEEFKKNYGPIDESSVTGAYSGHLEEISADLTGNRFMDPEFMRKVFTTLAATSPDRPNVVLRFAALVQRTIRAVLKAVSGQGYAADMFVKNLNTIEAHLTELVTQYAKQRELPAREMERQRLQAAHDVARTPLAKKAEPEFNATRETATQGRIAREEAVGKKALGLFEVAPHPDDKAAVAKWEAMTPAQKKQVSEQTAMQIVPKVLKELDTHGSLVRAVGAWKDKQNPSFMLHLEDPSKLPEAARMLGHVLNQESVGIVNDRPFEGSTPGQEIRITLPKVMDADGLKGVYNKLREITNEKGEPVINGHTSVPGSREMSVLNTKEWTGADSHELAQKMQDKLGPGYRTETRDVHMAFPERGVDYGKTNGDEANGRGAEAGAELHGPADLLRDEASRLVSRNIERSSGAGGAREAEGSVGNRESRNAISESPARKEDHVVEGWRALAKNKDLFGYATSDSKHLDQVIKDVAPTMQLTHVGRDGEDRVFTMAPRDAGDEQWATIIESPKTIKLDIQVWPEGGEGSRIYAVAAEYARNTGKTFIEDTHLSDRSTVRRTENMLASGLKHDTTEHMMPGKALSTGLPSRGTPGLKWERGNHEANLRSMIQTTHDTVYNNVAGMRGIQFDPISGKFKDGTGKEVTDERFKELAQGDDARRARAGATTLKRAAITESLLRAEAEGRGAKFVRELSASSGVAREVAEGGLNKLSYSPARAKMPERLEGRLPPESIRTLQRIIKNLNPAEVEKLNIASAQALVDHFSNLPPTNEFAAVAKAGEAKRGWYRHSAEAIANVFGVDAPRFAGLLAAMSPQTGVEANLRNAAAVWRDWNKAGRPQDRESILRILGSAVEGQPNKISDKDLPAWRNNTVRALTEDPAEIRLSGPKVDSFMRNLLGNVDEVTNDSWMANFANVDQKIFAGGLTKSGNPGKRPGYLAMTAKVREAADRLTALTGETWSPAEVQETIWSWSKALYEMQKHPAEMRGARDIIADHALHDDLIAATPDFRTQFHEPRVEQALRDAGHGAELDKLRAGADHGAAGTEEPAPGGKTAAFTPETQQRHELNAASRLEALHERRLAAGDITASTARDRGFGDLTPEQETALKRAGALDEPATLKERLDKARADWKLKLIQGVVDEFRAIKDVSPKGYQWARQSRGSEGTIEAALMFGKPFMHEGAPDVKINDPAGGFAKVMANLKGEHNRFLWWIAGQRAESLQKHGLERLMTGRDIEALKSMDQGTMPDGRAREQVYAETLKNYQDFNNSMLDIARQSGLIDAKTHAMFKDAPYVPFYRVWDDERAPKGPTMSSGLTSQYAWKKITGGTNKLNADLLDNTLRNWAHLLGASAKNRAALRTVDDAVAAHIAEPVEAGTKDSLRVMRNGQAQAYLVHDPYVAEAMGALNYVAPSYLKPFGVMKRALTYGITASPVFKVRTLIRETLAALTQSDISRNAAGNLVQGWQNTNIHSQIFASLLAGGGQIRFGSMERGPRVNAMIERAGGTPLDEPTLKRWGRMVGDMAEVYHEFGNRVENVNRAALYEQLMKKGYSHDDASFAARDLLDFTASGRWPVVKFLTQSVPFMNARLQSLYSMGRTYQKNPAAVGAVIGAISLASLGLMLTQQDEQWWKDRKDYDRDAYWAVKVGDKAFYIPKPFELGAFGTMAERTWELAFNKDFKAGDWTHNFGQTILNTFSFDPTPQLVKPLTALYANQDPFTHQPIENRIDLAMRPQDRADENTSTAARLLGQMGLPEPTSLLQATYKPLSPKQIDYALRAYFGSLATFTNAALDAAARPLADKGPSPAFRTDTWTGGFIRDLPSNQSRFVEELYKKAQEVDEAYSSVKHAQETGDWSKLKDLMGTETDLLRQRPVLTAAEKRIGEINKMIRQTEASQTLSSDTKRNMLDQLNQQKNTIARSVMNR